MLKTKLYTPRASLHAVERPQLNKQLAAAAHNSVSIVCAPAGYGKTTAVASWLRAREEATAWLSLDAYDDEPYRFWHYLCAALQTIDNSLAQKATSLLDSYQQVTKSFDADEVLTLLINDLVDYLEADNTPEHIYFALDDYHHIRNESIHRSMAFLLKYIPHGMHIILCTRQQPKIELLQMRGAGRLVEIGPNELSFNLLESEQLLNSHYQLALADSGIDELLRRTEGWPAGLSLAAISLQSSNNPSVDAITNFSGSYQVLSDYLMSEVFECQSEEVQQFLLLGSALPRLCSSLCDCAFGIDYSAIMIEQLVRNNLFIVPLGESHNWFRYHDLLREFLLQRLQRQRPADYLPMLRRAAQWFEQHDYPDEAVTLLIKAEDWSQAIAMIIRLSTALVKRGARHLLNDWCNRLPKDLVDDNPKLLLLQMKGLPESEQLLHSPRLLQRAQQLIDSSSPKETTNDNPRDNDALRAEIFLNGAILARFTLKMDQMQELLERAEPLIPTENITLRGQFLRENAINHYMRGDLNKAVPLIEESIAFGRRHDAIDNVIISLCYLITTEVIRGDFTNAQAHRDSVRRWMHQHNHISHPLANSYDRCAIELLREQHQLEEAGVLSKAQQAENYSAHIMPHSVQQHSLNYLYCRTLLSMHAYAEAETMVSAMEASPWILWSYGGASVAATRARLAHMRGHYDDAWHWAEQQQQRLLASEKFADEEDQLILARIYRHRGLHQPCLDLCEGIAQRATPNGRIGRAVCSNIISALVLADQGNTDSAMQHFAGALHRARAHGFVSLFLDEGEACIHLLRRAIENGIESGYCERILQQRQSYNPTTTPVPKLLSIAVDAEQNVAAELSLLSRREREILTFLQQGYSNKLISETLFISLSTVKTHLSNIYRKLEVKSRTQALRKISAAPLVQVV
ncbi:ATP/maltotriose-dependent transcriptional regulator MalT [Sinobacterium caligoides]|uniref:ATP/maltotriose-dependent transcriptional regulator MalT n=1 Tax=Sinobacterium caligoides TaxID=933926 RepID=A0A3N2DLJ2_9GAMM|nr:LuxR C-terminal-related transcriptional regulator [Sinobacterium caligoides]ROS00225.1 ATP/maltotriose-dependent transcriptional regulator MalT [Sinobacterium caligoides]